MFVLLILLAGLNAAAQEPVLEKILTAHFRAMEMEKFITINTMEIRGLMIQQDAMPVKILRKRPDLFIMEYDVMDMTTYQGYDGDTAWMTMPWTGSTKPQILSGDRAGDMKIRADFDGVLHGWQEKGFNLEADGIDTVDHQTAWRLKLTKPDGNHEFLFIDQNSHLLVKRLYHRMIRGKEATMEIFFRDYRQVNGIPFAFIQDTHYDGQPYNSLQVDSVKYNEPLDDRQFRIPRK